MTETTRHPKPDQGYAWIMVVINFTAHVIIDGILYSFGVLLIEFVEHFETSHSRAALINAVMLATNYGPGILWATLISYVGFRPVGVCGSLLAMLGLALCYFATSIEHLFLLLGVAVGLGLGMLEFSVMLAMNHWFDKRINIATGLAMAGSGVGVFIMPPLMNWMLAAVGWRGSMLILSGLVGQCVVVSMLLKQPPEFSSDEKDSSKENLTISNAQSGIDGLEPLESSTECKLDRDADLNSNEQQQNVGLLKHHRGEKLEVAEAKSAVFLSNHSLANLGSTSALSFGGSIAALDFHHVIKSQQSVASRQTTDHETENSAKSNCFQTLLHVCKHMFDFSVLRIMKVDLVLITSGLCQVGYVVPFVFLPDKAISLGISKGDAALLISVLAASNMASRLLFGAAGDYFKNHRAHISSAILFATGGLNIASILFKTFPFLILYALGHGVFLGCVVALHPVVMRDLVGLAKYGKAYSFMLIAIAVLCLFTGPFIGWVYDVTHSYDIPFVICGVAIITGGVSMLIVSYTCPCIKQSTQNS